MDIKAYLMAERYKSFSINRGHRLLYNIASIFIYDIDVARQIFALT